MLSRALLLSFCTAGVLQCFSEGSTLDSALQLVSNSSKTFYRVDQRLSWEEAMWYCQENYTDLADLESLNSMNGIRTLSSLVKEAAAWIGLFYDKYISGLSWSSGSTFTSISWNDLPDMREGFCAMLYLQYDDIPHLGAAPCKELKPCICYYDHAVGHRFSRASSQEGAFTLPEKATVLIGGWNFTRITHNMSWSLALNYCRNHYTDLADLQVVRNAADIATLKHLTTGYDAWIGLYFSPKSNSLTWSSGWDAGIPQWVENQPLFGKGFCAGIRSFANKDPGIYALDCSALRHFICYYDSSTGHRKSVKLPSLRDSPSSEVTQSSEVTVGTSPRPSTGTSTDPVDASQGLVSATWLQPRVSPEPTEVSSVICGSITCDPKASISTPVSLLDPQSQESASLSPLATSSSLEGIPVPGEELSSPLGTALSLPYTGSGSRGGPSVSEEVSRTPQVTAASAASGTAEAMSQSELMTPLEVSMSPWPGTAHDASSSPMTAVSTGSESSTSSWSLNSKTLWSSSGTKEGSVGPFISKNSAELQRNPPSSSAAGRQVTSPEPGSLPATTTAVSRVEDGTDRRHKTAAAFQAHDSTCDHPQSTEEPAAAKLGDFYGILKADFIISDLNDPEKMKDQFLREIQEVLKLILCHEQFMLKWVSLEVNKK